MADYYYKYVLVSDFFLSNWKNPAGNELYDLIFVGDGSSFSVN